MYRSYFRIAWRNFFRNKVSSSINTLGLSAGMTVAILIGLWLWDELTFNDVHQNHDQLAGVWLTQTFDGKMQTGAAISIPLAAELKNNYSNEFKHLALASWNWNHTLSASKEKVLLKEGMYAEAAFPEMFSLQMIEGNASSVLIEPYSIVLSESVARALFGNESATGKYVRVDNLHDTKVTGVYKDFPVSSEFKRVKILLPWSLHEKEDWVRNSLSNWRNHSWQLFAQIQDNHSMDSVSKKITGIEKKYNKEGNPVLLLHPMNCWHLYEEFKDGVNSGGKIQYVWLFSIIGALVVLLACINYMNLSTARSQKRAREVGIRKTVGSGRGYLIIQFLGESFLISGLSLILAVSVASLLLPSFNMLANKEIVFPSDNYKFWLTVILFSTAIASLAGSYPAFYLSSLNPLRVLSRKYHAGSSATRTRQVLVVFQFTVSITLLAGTFIVFSQIEFSKSRSLGYSKDKLIYTGVIPEMRGKYEQLRNELLQTRAVAEISQSSGPTTDIWSNETGFNWEGKDPNTEPSFGTLDCTHDFGKTIGWQIKEGRDFSRNFPSDSSAIILNESAAKLIGPSNVIGKTVRQDQESSHVIGVVKDLMMESPYSTVKPTIFKLGYKWVRVTNIRLSPDMKTVDAMAKIEALFKRLSPDNSFEFRFADDEYNVKFSSENRISQLARIFTVLAMLIACLGLIGLSSFSAEQRTKEIGIRKVLGANVANITALLSLDFVKLVLIAILIASPLAYYAATKWLENFTYRIEISWWVFVLAGVSAIIVAMITVSVQAIKAAVANPVNSLQTE